MVTAALEFRQVTLGYPGRIVLENIDFKVDAGEVFAIVGPNGVGKSTLIRAASGILSLERGKIWIQGQDIVHLSPASRARLVAVVPQAIHLPPSFRAMEMVLMGRTPYLGWLEREDELDRKLAMDAMRRTSTDQLADRRVGELSGGEQQRLLVARAVAQSASVLLLDEPTAHLDLRHQDRTLKLVRELAKEQGLGVLIALHDLNLVARFSDRVALLSDGGIKSIGDPRQVLTPSVLGAAYGVEIHVVDDPIHGTPLVLTG